MKLNFNVKTALVRKIVSISHKGKKRDFHIAAHKHAWYGHEMIYVDYGNVRMRIDDDEFILKSGECVFIPGGAEHSFSGVEGSHFDYLNVMYRGRVHESIFRKSLHVNRNCLELMERLKKETSHKIPFCKQIVGCYFTELIIHFIRQEIASLPGKPLEPASRHRYRSAAVNRAMTAIANSYSTPITPKQVSKSVGVSESHLRTLLRQETGKSFRLIVREHRVAAAKHLLLDSEFPIQEIANAVGYHSSSFFFRIFKRLTGMTPKEYSQSLGEPDFSNS